MDFTALFITLKLALITTAILLLVCLPLGYWLAKSNNIFSNLVGTIVSLPLVLPPTVLGFYLLVAFGSHGPIGKITEALNLGTLAFSFTGLVIGSVIYSLPFVLGPIQSAFEGVDKKIIHLSYTLGASPLKTFFKVIIPSTRAGIISGAILGFCHTLGEFGVVLMIGGSIPGETRVISVSIYDHVELLDYSSAHTMSLALLGFSFLVMFPIYQLRKKTRVI